MTYPGRAAAPALPLPRALWRQAARGVPDAGTLRLLRTARTGRNLLLLRALHRTRTGGPGGRLPGIDLLAAVRRHAPAVFDSVLSDPAAGAALAEAVRTGRHGAVAVLAAAAGHRSGLAFRLDVPVSGGMLVLPGLGHAVLGADAGATARVERGAGGTVVRCGSQVVPVPDGPGWTPVPRLRFAAHGAELAVRLERHGPEGLGTAGPSGPEVVAGWRGRLGAAWEVLAARHPDRARAVGGTVRAVLPLDAARSAPGGGQRLGASVGDAFGLVGLAPLDDPAGLAALLVHEAQHSLLYALQDLTRLIDAPPGARAPAPWSDRPRPPSALLQGTAAFLVTAGFWRTEAALGNPRAPAPYEQWRLTARRACDELARGGWLTDHGRLLLDAIRTVLDEWDATPPPVRAR
ncbi:HEXXH motif-containing putative peptide modification protein [Streptomyces sp. NPDC051940]|uniref:aKG-HExxH-type peptide beta-hydroxylase n=1 Tax=Streptomyces sp. NPDC051940 TaxID=3155675 RepID=UPI003444FDDA